MRDLKIFTSNVEKEALNQIDDLLSLDAFKNSKIRIMPDVHAGKGCVIGFTGNLGEKVIPNVVGVDIGCGMLCVNLGNIEIDLEKLDKVIRKFVPSGMNVHEEKVQEFDLTKLKCFSNLVNVQRLENSLGTLGSGNHFIEIDIDNDNNKYLIIHSGSRNLGVQVAEYYQKTAIEMCNNNDEYKKEYHDIIINYKKDGKEKEINEKLKEFQNKYKERKKEIPKEFAYLEGDRRNDYLNDMKICQKFASLNRMVMAEIICRHMGIKFDDYFETIHNYISFEDNIVRKGSISAKKGERVLIPMNMKDGCIVAIGKGNDDWNQSAPHGAGRLMSRKKAKEILNLNDYKNSMKDIYTTSVCEETIDEAPAAYKNTSEIIENIKDTVDVEKIIKPIYNYKDSSLI